MAGLIAGIRRAGSKDSDASAENLCPAAISAHLLWQKPMLDALSTTSRSGSAAPVRSLD
jgi:hypothetical protein